MTDRASLIEEIVIVMRDWWDLPPDCNDGELFAYAEMLFDRIEAGDSADALYRFLAEVQHDNLEMPASDAAKKIVDRSVDLVRSSR